MNAPRLKYVSGSAFGSLVEPFKVELPETGLVLLRGENLDTGGSSGSGKSTLIQAMNYPFGTCDVPSTELQSWYTEEAPVSKNFYVVDGKEVEVTKGKRFELKIDGVTFKGSAAQKDAELDKLFGMDAEMRAMLTYRGQRKPGLFLSKTDAQKKEFLTKLLGLDKFEKAQDDGAENVKRLQLSVDVEEAKLADIDQRLSQLVSDSRADVEARAKVLQGQAAGLRAEKVRLEKEVADAHNDAAVLEKSAFEIAQPELDSLNTRLQELAGTVVSKVESGERLDQARVTVDEVGRRLQRLKATDAERKQALEVQNRELTQAINRLSFKVRKIDTHLADRSRIRQDLESLAADVCPTCERAWVEAASKRSRVEDELARVETAIADCGVVAQEMERLQKEQAALPKFEPNPNIDKMTAVLEQANITVMVEYEKLNSGYATRVAERDQQIAAAQTERALLRERVAKAAAEYRSMALAEVPGWERQVVACQAKLQQLQPDVDAVNYELGRAEEVERQRAYLAKQKEGFQDNLEPLRLELAREKDFLHLIGREGFLGSIFDEVLEEISAETNEVLASIANTRHCTLEFKSETLTQKGTARREIVPVVTINGHKASLKFGPSGGMLSAIELAVDLAVGAVISRRTGVCPGWLVLDETFDGLGPVEKETCLEILQKYAHDRLVLVVDHMSETQGLFTHRVTVKYSGGKSRIC